MDSENKEINDELALLARRHYISNFPNPQRRDCPPEGEIVKVVNSGQAPDQSLLNHLFACSECFGEYRQALAKRREAAAFAPDAKWRRVASALLARPIWAAMVLLLFFFGVGLILRQITPGVQKGRVAVSTSSAAQPAAQAEAPTPKQDEPSAPAEAAQSQAGQNAKGASGLPGLLTVSVDLDDHRVLRDSQEEKTPGADERPSGKEDEKSAGRPDAGSAEENIITLPAARIRLSLRLPESGVAGDYTVSLVDAFDFVLLSHRAVSRDGVKLRVALDLRRVAPEKYRLRLSREGEAPAYYDVVIKKR